MLSLFIIQFSGLNMYMPLKHHSIIKIVTNVITPLKACIQRTVRYSERVDIHMFTAWSETK